MFCRAPIMASSRVALTAAGGEPNDVGNTSPPEATRPPDFQITAQQRPHQGWFATVQLHSPAQEGTNQAAYLAPGTYSTDLMMLPGGALTAYLPGAGNRRIHMRVSQHCSTLSRMAEQEHCDDVLEAYRLTMAAAEQAIRGAVAQNPFGPARKRDAAMRLARTAIAAGLHARLARIFTDCIDPNAMVRRHDFATRMRELFLDVCNGTMQRDFLGHHTFRLGNVVAPGFFASLFTTPANNREDRDLITGPALQIPGLARALVIHL